MTESRRTVSPVQLLFGLEEVSAIGEQIRAFAGNDSATCIKLSDFEGAGLNHNTSGSGESRYERPTLVTVSGIFAEVWGGDKILSDCVGVSLTCSAR